MSLCTEKLPKHHFGFLAANCRSAKPAAAKSRSWRQVGVSDRVRGPLSPAAKNPFHRFIPNRLTGTAPLRPQILVEHCLSSSPDHPSFRTSLGSSIAVFDSPLNHSKSSPAIDEQLTSIDRRGEHGYLWQHFAVDRSRPVQLRQHRSPRSIAAPSGRAHAIVARMRLISANASFFSDGVISEAWIPLRAIVTISSRLSPNASATSR
jgi:hypothetical protein